MYALAALLAVVTPRGAFPHDERLLFNTLAIAAALVVDGGRICVRRQASGLPDTSTRAVDGRDRVH